MDYLIEATTDQIHSTGGIATLTIGRAQTSSYGLCRAALLSSRRVLIPPASHPITIIGASPEVADTSWLRAKKSQRVNAGKNVERQLSKP